MRKINMSYKGKNYEFIVYDNNLKIYLDKIYGNNTIEIRYYDESEEKIKSKKFNYQDFGLNQVSTKAAEFVANLYNLDEELYNKIFDMYEISKSPKNFFEELCKNRKKHIFKV